MKEADLDPGFEAVVKRLRRRDYASYLSVRMAPEAVREPLFWLQGFFHDVAQIPYKVDEPLLGEIRLQWWRDAITKLGRGERIGHPVADGLQAVLEADDGLLAQAMTGIVDSYRFDVQKSPVPDMPGFYGLMDQRYGGLLRAGLLIGGHSRPETVLMATEAGMAIGATEVIAQLPLALGAQLQPLPQDMLAAHGLSHQDLLSPAGAVPTLHERVGKALYAIADGAVIISWDIKSRYAHLKRAERVYFSRWLIVPALLKRALEDRRQSKAVVTTLNPLRIYMTQMRGMM